MKKILALFGAVAFAAALTSSVSAQPAGSVVLTDPFDSRLVSSSGTYVISEYYCANDGHTGPYTVHGLTFTNNIARVGGNGTGNLQTPMFGSSQDGTNLWTISEGEQWQVGGFDFTLPTAAGHSYVLEILFHDNFFTATGARVFNVEAGPPSATAVVVANMDLVAMGAGKNNAVDVLARCVLNDSDGSGFRIILLANINNPCISALALLDVTDLTPGGLAVITPTPQVSYVGLNAAFTTLVAGSGLTYQWQSDAGGSMANLSDSAGAISGSSTRNPSLSNLTPNEQANYQLVVTKTSDASTVTLGPAALTVYNIPGLSLLTSPNDLLLSGSIIFAEYYGDTWPGTLPIRGVNFVNKNARLGGNPYDNLVPYFGSSQDDTNLAWISYGDVWTNGNFGMVLPTLVGRDYVVQLLFHDNAYTTAGSRIFSVWVGPPGSETNWVPYVDLALAGAYETQPKDVLLTLGVTNADGNNLSILINQGSANNPMISAMTYQDVGSGAAPPLITVEPNAANPVCLGRKVILSATVAGSSLTYKWQSDRGGSYADLSDGAGGNIWGVTTPTLTITNIAYNETANYRLTIQGAFSTNTSPANVFVLPNDIITASANYDWAVMTNNAVDYWRLNETNLSVLVYDSGPGAKDAVVGANATVGVQTGPEAAAYPGFQFGNTCLTPAVGGYPDSWVTAPALNLNTNTVTMVAWINPGAQSPPGGEGILFSRQNGGSGAADFGLGYGVTPLTTGGTDYTLRYFWNGASYDSRLLVPQGGWSMIAVVVTPTNGTVYIVNNSSGLYSWTTNVAHAVCAFSNPFLIGNDNNDPTWYRVFNGQIDEVSVFNSAFTGNQILSLFTKASQVLNLPPTITGPTPTVAILNPGGTTSFSCTVNGTPTPTKQWMMRSVGFAGGYVNVVDGPHYSGSQTATLTISGMSAATMGDYVLFASNYVGSVTVGTITSSPARALVVQQFAPALIGRWLTGDQSLADESGFAAAGVHDGIMTSGFTSWDTGAGNVPPGFDTSLSSLNLANSGGEVKIANSATSDSDYRLDYDNNITNRFTVAVWAKGWPNGAWIPFMGKNCEAVGWAVRRGANIGPNPIFSVVGPSTGANSTYSGAAITDTGWHHYAGTWDGSTGIRRLYVDGNLVACTARDFGSVTPANSFHLVLGAEENPAGTITRPFANGYLFDARLYNYSLAQAEIQSMLTPATANAVGLYLDAPYPIPVGQSEPFTVTIPVGANAGGPITVTIVNNSPSVATIRGATSSTFIVVFAKGAPNTQSFILDIIGPGTISLSATATGGLSAGTLTDANVVLPGMIGHWLTGTENLTDSINVDGTGAHDGQVVGTGAAAWDGTDRPSAFSSGSSLNFATANYGMAIKGSSKIATADTYYPTFDVNIADGFSCSFWAKGTPGTYNPWVSKYGDGNGQPGWEVRQNNNVGQPSFRLLQTADNVDNGDTFNSIHSFTYLGSTTWHHYVASYDSMGGFRRIYIDGVLSVSIPNDFGPVPPQPYPYLVFGALDGANANQATPAHSYSKYFNGKMFDLRMYNYPLNAGEALAVMNPNDSTSLRAVADYKTIDVGQTGTISFSLPEGVSAATVHVNNQNPSVVSIAGHPTNPFDLVFSSSTPRAAVLTLNGLSEGQATIQFSASAPLTTASATVKVANGSHLVGHWLVGAQNLNEYSGFTPAGTHDGAAYAGNTSVAKTAVFAASAPSGFPGSSLSIPSGAGAYAIVISNTAGTLGNPMGIDGNYQSTFDDLLANRCTIAFWENGGFSQNNWVGLVGKLGEGDAGYLVHRNNATTAGDFVIKSTSSHFSDLLGSANLFNSTWHHIAAVWDGYTGVRQLYVDNVLEASWTGDYGPMSMAPNHHLVFGSEEGDSLVPPSLGRNGYLTGNLYDVRIYNYALSQTEINNLRTVPGRPTITTTIVSGNIRFSWSAAYPGYVVQTAPAVLTSGTAWTTPGLTVTLQNGQYTATDTAPGTGPKYYRLVLQ